MDYKYKIYKYKSIIFLPFIIIHEISHLLFIILFDAEIKNIKITKIKYNSSKINYTKNYIINTAPLIIHLILIIILISKPIINNEILYYYTLSGLLITSLPSKEDYKNIKNKQNGKEKQKISTILIKPLIVIEENNILFISIIIVIIVIIG